MQTPSRPSVKVGSAKRTERLPAGRKVARVSKRSGSSSSSPSEESAEEGKKGERRRVGSGSETRYGEAQGDGSTKAGYRERGAALNFVKRIECSSDSDSPGRVGA